MALFELKNGTKIKVHKNCIYRKYTKINNPHGLAGLSGEALRR
jgi:hypothetical protein